MKIKSIDEIQKEDPVRFQKFIDKLIKAVKELDEKEK